ncbi:MAG: M20 family metallopeptidase [Pigmentiphaga sp.]|nr:M20 family metallopeptidase [Pigmentiphaga sp.]
MEKGARWGAPLQAIQQWHDALTAIRQDLHANPELGFQEVRTSGIVAKTLSLLGYEVTSGIARTGVVGVLKGQQSDSGLSIGLRADMDALPMTETNTFLHRSQREGLAHGCGHDGHTTMLLGAAKYLAQTRRFNGTAVLIFQPAEEGLGGAKAMIEEGLFERFPCDRLFALHNWPALPPGTIGINDGPMMAAADRFEVVVRGRGGHGAHPYQAIDPVVVSAHIITALQTIVARNINPIDAAVLSVCAVQAGQLTAMSVIPHEARLVGTVRTFRKTVQTQIEQRIYEIATQVAAAFGATAEMSYERVYPATLNTPKEARFVGDVASRLFGEPQVIRDLPPSLGSEDFSLLLQHCPGAYFRLGQGGAEDGKLLHGSNYDFNDAVLPAGAAMMAALVEQGMPLTEPAESYNVSHLQPASV